MPWYDRWSSLIVGLTTTEPGDGAELRGGGDHPWSPTFRGGEKKKDCGPREDEKDVASGAEWVWDDVDGGHTGNSGPWEDWKIPFATSSIWSPPRRRSGRLSAEAWELRNMAAA